MSFTESNQKIAEQVVKTHHQIENDVVSAYQKTKDLAVNSFNSVSDKFIARFFTRDGESVESAKARLKASAEKSKQHHKEMR